MIIRANWNEYSRLPIITEEHLFDPLTEKLVIPSKIYLFGTIIRRAAVPIGP